MTSDTGVLAYIAKGRNVTVASRKTIVRPASRILSAISFGVFWRTAPSTSAIMRSRKDSPGLVVIWITMRSESTVVPPVTALRSPPDSRITGADSPVMADSSTEATPSITVPSAGIACPASTTTTSPFRSCEEGTCSTLPVARAAERLGLGPGFAQVLGLRLAAPFGHGLGEVGEKHREPEPERDLAAEERFTAPMVCEVRDEAKPSSARFRSRPRT